jgi:ATP-dependent Clp protease ATP-binding subunit ClpA
MWISDKQAAFVQGIREVFPGTPHRYCANHFLRDVAKPILEADSRAKVQMRQKVRGLRQLEREILEARQGRSAASPLKETVANAAAFPPIALPGAEETRDQPAPAEETGDSQTTAEDVVLDYCATVRGILNDNQGGPLEPPGLRMAAALEQVRASIQRNLDQKKRDP